MANKIIKIKSIEVGVNYPPFHPNCRTTTIPHFEPDEIDAMFKQGERIARGSDGKNYMVPDNLSYNEWKAGLVQQENGQVRYVQK